MKQNSSIVFSRSKYAEIESIMDARKVHNYWHLGCLLLVTLGLFGCADQPIPPQQALSESDTQTILQKISGGYDVNSQDGNGYTALHWAAYSGRLDAAQVLVAHGAEIEALDNSQMTPLLVATSYERAEVAAYLVSRGANVNARDSTGWTPLAYAVSNRDTGLAVFLLHHGANANARTDDGESIRSLCARYNATGCQSVLRFWHGND
jgi:ankyrin repeat protein